MSGTTAAPAPSTELVHTETVDGIGILTLSDPHKRNALSSTMLQQMRDALASFAAAKLRVVIVTDDPDARVFSAGHNIAELSTTSDPLGYAEPLELTLRAVRAYPGPVIAMIHGTVWGGAFDLVCSCDMIIADETATFAITPANLGLPYNTAGLLHFLSRLPLNLIKEMFFTATPIVAQQALDWHIINHLVPAAQLRDFTLDFARKIVPKAPMSIAVVKEQLRVLTDEHAVSSEAAERIASLRAAVWTSQDMKEGIAAFFEKRKPNFQGQ